MHREIADDTNSIKYVKVLLQNSPNQLAVVDSGGRFQYCTGVFLATLGLDGMDQLIGRHYKDVLEQYGNEEVSDAINDALGGIGDNKANFSCEVDLKPQGMQKHYNMTIKSMAGDGGDGLLGYLIALTDITDLVTSRDEAIYANKAKSEFIASMSHEIRTPLNAIMGLAEMVLRQSISQRTATNVRKIYNSGRILLNLVNDVLDFSKIEAGKFTLCPVKYYTQSMINEAISMNVTMIGAKPIVFRLNVDEGMPSVLYGDELRVKQIISNLLSNAIKYTESGTVEMRIGAEKAEGKALVKVVVRDTGIGIAEDDIKLLFEKYMQFHEKETYGLEGTGLGLPIVKHIAELMGGEVSVKSAVGRGSAFTVAFWQEIGDESPLGDNAGSFFAMPNEKQQGASQDGEIEYDRLPYGRVLLVDDVELNLDVAKGLLEDYQMQITTALSGDEALKIIREGGEFDLVFMDHMMPGMDGVEALKAIRELGTDYASRVPIVMLTANALLGNEKRFLESGFDAYLPKPIDIYKLDTIIKKYVKNDGTEADAANGTGEGMPGAQEGEPGRQRLKACLLAYKAEWLDTEKALGRFGNNPRSYFSTLCTFHDRMDTVMEGLALPEEGGLADYRRLVHGVKGSLYSIGADRLGRLAEDIERHAGMERLDKVAGLHQGFIDGLGSLAACLESLISRARALEAPEGGKPPRLMPERASLERLLKAAQAYDIEEMSEEVGRLSSYSYRYGGELVDALNENLAGYDYDAIREALSLELG